MELTEYQLRSLANAAHYYGGATITDDEVEIGGAVWIKDPDDIDEMDMIPKPGDDRSSTGCKAIPIPAFDPAITGGE